MRTSQGRVVNIEDGEYVVARSMGTIRVYDKQEDNGWSGNMIKILSWRRYFMAACFIR